MAYGKGSVKLSFLPELIITAKALDEASAALKQLAQNAEGSFRQVEGAGKKLEQQQKQTDASTKDLVLGFNSLVAGGMALYSAYDRVTDMQVSVDRANLQVKSSLNSVEDAQRRYNDAVDKYGASSEQAVSAQKDLALAQERYEVACERAEMIQGNLNEVMVQSAITVVPNLIMMVERLIKVKKDLASATDGASTSLSSLASSSGAAALGISAAAITISIVGEKMTLDWARSTGNLIVLQQDMMKQNLLTQGQYGRDLLKQADEIYAKQLAALSGNLDAQYEYLANWYAAEEFNAHGNQERLLASSEQYLGMMESVTAQHYETEYAKAMQAYMDEFGVQEVGLDKLLEGVSSHFDQVIMEADAAYNEQVTAANAFYDELIAAANQNLNDIRAVRTAELNDLELNMLLQKQALKSAHEEGKISTEEYNARVAEIEKTYNDKRREVSDSFRIQELEAQKKAAAETTTINADRAAKVESLEKDHSATVQGIEQEKSSKVAEIQGRDAEIRKELQNRITELERQKNEERTKITEDNTAKQSSTIKTGVDNQIFDLNRLGGAFSGLSNSIGNALSNAGNNIVNFFNGLASRISQGIQAIQNFIGSICFAHAIERATKSASKDLALWLHTVESSMAAGLGAIKEFNAGAEGGLGVGVPLSVPVGGGSVSRTVIIQEGAIRIGSVSSDMDLRTLAKKLAEYTTQEERRQGLS